jgi:hypothetical protein
MPIAMVPAPPHDPKGWAVMGITETAKGAHIVEVWPKSSGEIADIAETTSGAGPNVELSLDASDPLSCDWQAYQTAGYRRPGWDVALRAEVLVHSDATHFHVQERTLATLNGAVIADVKHKESIARRLM